MNFEKCIENLEKQSCIIDERIKHLYEYLKCDMDMFYNDKYSFLEESLESVRETLLSLEREHGLKIDEECLKKFQYSDKLQETLKNINIKKKLNALDIHEPKYGYHILETKKELDKFTSSKSLKNRIKKLKRRNLKIIDKINASIEPYYECQKIYEGYLSDTKIEDKLLKIKFEILCLKTNLTDFSDDIKSLKAQNKSKTCLFEKLKNIWYR